MQGVERCAIIQMNNMENEETIDFKLIDKIIAGLIIAGLFVASVYYFNGEAIVRFLGGWLSMWCVLWVGMHIALLLPAFSCFMVPVAILTGSGLNKWTNKHSVFLTLIINASSIVSTFWVMYVGLPLLAIMMTEYNFDIDYAYQRYYEILDS